MVMQWRSKNAAKVTYFKGRQLDQEQWFSPIVSLFKIVTSHKGKNLLPNSFPIRAIPYAMENRFLPH